MVDSPTKTTCAGGGVSQSKKGSVIRREMGIPAEKTIPQSSTVPIGCRMFY